MDMPVLDQISAKACCCSSMSSSSFKAEISLAVLAFLCSIVVSSWLLMASTACCY
jgi:hypothetical protein